MANVRVWILYEPLIYADLFHWIFERIGMVDVMRAANPGEKLTDRESFQGERMEVIILPLDDQGQPRLDFLPDPPSGAKYLAFSPDGKKGLKRLPGTSFWQEVSPFGLENLMFEVFDQFDGTVPELIMPASKIG